MSELEAALLLVATISNFSWLGPLKTLWFSE